MPAQSHQLVAIMFTDIVGYTELMGKDRNKALELLNKNRHVQGPIIKKHHGRWLKEMGDGVLASFSSVSDAVYCAKEIQEVCRDQTHLKLRIGIHLGEVVVEGDDIFGDGVNIASRIEPLGTPGSILVSGNVQQQIKNNPEFKLDLLGSFNLKNVEDPIAIYALSNAGFPVPHKDHLLEKIKSPDEPTTKPYPWKSISAITVFLVLLLLFVLYKGDLFQKNESFSTFLGENSIAVLPFENLSNNPEQAYFVDGIHDDILHHIASNSNLLVKSRTSTLQYRGDHRKGIKQIGRELGVEYVMEGSVRRTGDKVRISVQLIDARTDQHIWSEVYDRDLTNILVIQNEVASDIASVLKVSMAESGIPNTFQTIEVTAYDLVLRAKEILRVYNGERDNEEMIHLLDQSIKIDEFYAPAFTLLGEALTRKLHYGAGDPKIWVDSVLYCLNRAIELDPSDPQALIAKARILEHPFTAEIDEAWGLKERANQLAPNDSDNMWFLGWRLFGDTDRVEEGIEYIFQSLKLDWGRKDALFYIRIADLYETIGNYTSAKVYYDQALKINPDHAISLFRMFYILFFCEKEFEPALPYALKYEKNNPSSHVGLDLLGWTYTKLERWANAEEQWRKMSELEQELGDSTDITKRYLPWRHRLAYVIDQQGQHEEAIKLVQEDIQFTQRLISSYPSEVVGPEYYGLATMHAFLGNYELSMEALENSINSSTSIVPYEMLMMDPHFDPYHGKKRFIELADRYYKIRHNETREARLKILRPAMKEFEESVGLSNSMKN